MAQGLDAAGLKDQLGPFALVRSPEQEKVGGRAMGLAATQLASPDKVSEGALALLFQFEDLQVCTLPPLAQADSLTVGRQPDCDLVLDHPSVSKLHATLAWDAAANRCTLTDQGSTNGTFLNASVRVKKPLVLKDGDILSFGEVQFWFLLTETLHARLGKERSGTFSRGV